MDDLKTLTELGGLEGVANSLKSDTTKGLQGNDAADRRKHFGSNMRAVATTRSFWQIVWDVLGDKLLRILFFSGIISIIINEITEENKSIGKCWNC